jgi:hypothetical protein
MGGRILAQRLVAVHLSCALTNMGLGAPRRPFSVCISYSAPRSAPSHSRNPFGGAGRLALRIGSSVLAGSRNCPALPAASAGDYPGTDLRVFFLL